VSARRAGRTQRCGRPQAATRLAHARKFFDAAELIATDVSDDEANASVAASLAVLAGIAASDAACCARLGRRSRSQDRRRHIAPLDLRNLLYPWGFVVGAAR
jgi:hypothetical protein